MKRTQKLEAEIRTLRETVKQRTVELEEKKRELEIETALEKVRVIALGMHKPDDMPDVCKAISLQLQSLGLKNIRNVQTAIFYQDRGTYMNYEYYARHRKTFITEVDYTNHKLAKAFATKMLKGKGEVSITHIRGQKVKDWIAYQEGTNVFIDKYLQQTDSLHYYWHSLGPVALGISTYKQLAKEELGLFNRFLLVFELAYTRYLDIEKAMAQAREAQIQLALERVRARAIAMQNSSELGELVSTVFKELTNLDFTLTSCIIWIHETKGSVNQLWIASAQTGQPAQPFTIQPFYPPFFNSIVQAWKANDTHWIYTLRGKEKKAFEKEFFKELPGLPDGLKKALKGPAEVVFSASFNQFGALEIVETEALTPEKFAILHRFGKVFESSYTRFSDLKKAEAQAREAEIQLALERVRARSLAMHHTSELQEVMNIVAQQLLSMNIDMNGGVFMTINAEVGNDLPMWAAAGAANYAEKAVVPYMANPIFSSVIEAIRNGPQLVELAYPDQHKIAFFKHLFRYQPWKGTSMKWKKELLSRKGGYTRSIVVSQFTSIGMTNHHGRRFTKEENEILRRFGNVLEQSFTRFLDLQKAEAQAREAEIELALERVRARAMAMQKSEELREAAAVLYKELTSLHIGNLVNCGYVFIDEKNQLQHAWMTRSDGSIREAHTMPLLGDSIMNERYEKWKTGIKLFSQKVGGKKLRTHVSFANRFSKQLPGKDNSGTPDLPDPVFFYCGNFSDGYLHVITGAALSHESALVLTRFTNVFEQTYTRFLDLQKAEAQNREAQIELGLERVRAKAMAMQNSEELKELIATVFIELTKLDLALTRCQIMIFDTPSNDSTWWTANSEAPADPTALFIKYHELPPYLAYVRAWHERENKFQYILEGKDKNDWDDFLFSETELSTLPDFVKAGMREPGKVFLSASFNNFGCLNLATLAPLSDEQFDILLRFAKVFDLTYTRFNDLQKAEAQAREAIKRASVDRVRAEIASMRTTNDLERIQPLIWNELKTLGVPFIRCGVFIMDEGSKQVQTFLSTPDGKAIAAFRLPYYSTEQITQIITHWQRKQIFRDYMDEAAFAEYAKNLVLQGAVSSDEKYVTENRPTDLYLHFLPFLQGMLYVGNVASLNEEELQLVQNLADAFSTAYARYEDFNKLEVAKKQVDNTLNELQVTQKHLIQAEKMASLGELTAGIAHEIQNPLNFVNNFSELNKELLLEMGDEIEKGNMNEVKSIAKDVIVNEEKINQHGKRADAIVKGMLQHSRSSNGVKEPTDINALADEYLRLSYHGLRAKDNLFSATIKTDFDESIGTIRIIPQDIGRVVLNLINNAFYAVDEKKRTSNAKSSESRYEPTVYVSTKKINDKVEIKVADNGNGIPRKVLDKIFQPFFTTKPTGEGTGLGLSLSYDIVKAHGGEIKVETQSAEAAAQAGEENTGSEFKIILPIG